ncbi:MAG: phage integrase SAM-like domain-containing protein [Planctomycetales bacterium]
MAAINNLTSTEKPSKKTAESRKMVRSELMGRHSHVAQNDVRVNIYIRAGKYIARGRIDGVAFGKTIGSNVDQAEVGLRELLGNLDRDSFIRPSEQSRRAVRRRRVPRMTFRELIDEFLARTRRSRGDKTFKDYRSRLMPLLEFCERDDVERRYRFAADIDLDFLFSYREFLSERRATRNGKSNGRLRHLAPNYVRLLIETVGTMLTWAARSDVALLPADFVSPCTTEVAGVRTNKDPLRLTPFPFLKRMDLIAQTDAWELCQLGFSMVLPLRPDEANGLLVSDVDFEHRRLKFRTRLGGRDFNKGKQQFTIPLPKELLMLAKHCIGNRQAGPLLQDRKHFGRNESPATYPMNNDELMAMLEDFVEEKKPNLTCPADWKKAFRQLLRTLGGVSPNMLSNAFRKTADRSGIATEVKFYDTRASVTTEIEHSDISHLVQRYVTGHTTSDIMNEYVSLDPEREMQKYWSHIAKLLETIRDRAAQLGLTKQNIE